MLEKGCDYWWYDPNWHIGIEAPFNLEGHLWGAHVSSQAIGRSMRVASGPFRIYDCIVLSEDCL
jgi:hypothetical protein